MFLNIFFEIIFGKFKDRDFVMFSPETNQLLYLIDEDDFGDDEKFPASLFKRFFFEIKI